MIFEKKGGFLKDNLLKALEKIRGKKILLLGDLMLDKYVTGSVDRISPEAPVPILLVSHERYVPGGACNVASNIAALGGDVVLLGVVGNDSRKDLLFAELKKKNISCDHIIVDGGRPTIEKARSLAGTHQLLRVDYEDTNYINFNFEDKLYDRFLQLLTDVDCVVVSDYAKGVVTRRLMEKIILLCKQKKKIILVDPKPKHKLCYKGATYITPNHKELCEMGLQFTVNDDGSLLALARETANELETTLILTRGEKGITVVPKDREGFTIPTKAKEVYDVSGAGDTVVAMLALALSSGLSVEVSCRLANYAAGLVVGKLGTSTVTFQEVSEIIAADTEA